MRTHEAVQARHQDLKSVLGSDATRARELLKADICSVRLIEEYIQSAQADPLAPLHYEGFHVRQDHLVQPLKYEFELTEHLLVHGFLPFDLTASTSHSMVVAAPTLKSFQGLPSELCDLYVKSDNCASCDGLPMKAHMLDLARSSVRNFAGMSARMVQGFVLPGADPLRSSPESPLGLKFMRNLASVLCARGMQACCVLRTPDINSTHYFMQLAMTESVVRSLRTDLDVLNFCHLHSFREEYVLRYVVQDLVNAVLRRDIALLDLQEKLIDLGLPDLF